MGTCPYPPFIPFIITSKEGKNMSIYALVTAKVAPGKMGAAMELAIKVRERVNNIHPLGTEVLTNIGADVWTIHWLTKYDSLAHYEESFAQTMVDEDYQALLQKADEGGLFVEVTTPLFNIVP
jgi:hypothetical protein